MLLSSSVLSYKFFFETLCFSVAAAYSCRQAQQPFDGLLRVLIELRGGFQSREKHVERMRYARIPVKVYSDPVWPSSLNALTLAVVS